MWISAAIFPVVLISLCDATKLETAIKSSSPVLTHFETVSARVNDISSVVLVDFDDRLASETFSAEMLVKPMGGKDAPQTPLSFKSFPTTGQTGGFWIERDKFEWKCKTISSIDRSEVIATAQVIDNQWTHIVCQLDAQNVLTLYVNGVSNAIAHPIFEMNNDQPLKIGADVAFNQTLSSFFNGDISAVALYDRALDGNEVFDHVIAALEDFGEVTANELSEVTENILLIEGQIAEQNILLTAIENITLSSDSLDSIEENVNRLIGQTDSLFNSYHEHTREISDLGDSVEKNKNDIVTTKSDTQRVSTKLDKGVKDLQGAIASNTNSLNDVHISITSVNTTASSNSENIGTNTNNIEDLDQKQTSTQGQLDTMSTDLTQQINSIIEAANSSDTTLNGLLENLRTDVQTLQQDLSQFEKNILEHEIEIANLTETLETLLTRLNPDCFLLDSELNEEELEEEGEQSNGSKLKRKISMKNKGWLGLASKNAQDDPSAICYRPIAGSSKPNLKLIISIIVAVVIVLFVAGICYRIGKKSGQNIQPVRLDTHDFPDELSEPQQPKQRKEKRKKKGGSKEGLLQDNEEESS